MDLFSTHVVTTKFEHIMIISTMADTWAFKTHWWKLNVLFLPKYNRFATLNSEVSSKFIALLVNLVLIGIFNFQGCNPLSMHAFSHSNLPSPNFFVHVMVFYNPTWASFTFIKISPIETLSSSIVYWWALDMTCPKQVPPYKHNIFLKAHNQQ